MAQLSGGGLGYALVKAGQVWRTEAAAALRPWQLTVPQFFVMMALYRQQRHGWAPLGQSDVAARLDMDANTLSQVVRVLERRDLVLRTAHPRDLRIRSLTLTASGVSHSREASAAARALNDVFFSVVAPEQLDLLGDILSTLAAESENRA
jgi:DNA-binding MarR family transcriptional regulator